jgi:hypothetical protein
MCGYVAMSPLSDDTDSNTAADIVDPCRTVLSVLNIFTDIDLLLQNL